MHAQICIENEFFHIMKNIVQSKYTHVNILSCLNKNIKKNNNKKSKK